MKPTVSLSFYTIAVKDSSNLTQKPVLGSFDGKSDLLDLIEGYLKKIVTVNDDGARKKVFRILSVEKEGRYLKGIFETGDYGTRQAIVNARTKLPIYKTKKDDAVLIPFYFLFYIPADKHKGVIVLQRFKQHGIYEILATYLDLCFKGKFGTGYRLDKYVLTNTDLLNKMIEDSRISGISFTQTQWSDDIADEIGVDPKERKGSITLSINAGYNSKIPLKEKVQKLFSGKLQPNQIVELDNLGFNIEPNEVSVDLYFNGRPRTIRYSNNFNLRSIFDITDQVKEDNDGHPLFDSIHQIALELLEDVSKPLYEGRLER